MITIGKPVKILLVEDNIGDVGLIEEVFEEAKIRNNLHVAEDGEEAMLYLRGKGKFSGSLRPDIVILDLNLPNQIAGGHPNLKDGVCKGRPPLSWNCLVFYDKTSLTSVSYTHLRAHETRHDLVCRLLLEKKKH